MGLVSEIASRINCDNPLPPLGKEAVRSVQGMRTILTAQQQDFFLNDRQDRVDLDFVMDLEGEIVSSTPKLQNASDNFLISYFNSIQLWGGITGRNIYIKDGGLSKNLNIVNYRNFARICFSADSIEEIFFGVGKFNDMTPNVGIAFITKHVRFLSSINKSFGSLPIYDSIIANRLYGRRYVEFRDVLSYWREILDVSRDRSCSATVLERHIFNALRAGVGSVTAPPPAGNVG